MARLMRLPKEANAQPQMANNEAAQLIAEERKAVDEAVMDEIGPEEDSEDEAETEGSAASDEMDMDD